MESHLTFINSLYKKYFCFPHIQLIFLLKHSTSQCKNYSNIAFQQGMLHVTLDLGLTSI